jgi:hypothetical protein
MQRLTINITFSVGDLDTGRFTQDELSAAIDYINDFGPGFGDISAYALEQIEKYLEEQYGAAADEREEEAQEAQAQEARNRELARLGFETDVKDHELAFEITQPGDAPVSQGELVTTKVHDALTRDYSQTGYAAIPYEAAAAGK